MLRLRCHTEEDNADSGAETAESVCSKMSSTSSDVTATSARQVLEMAVHLLANPGDSLLLQHTLDRLLKRVCPTLRLFYVSERACPLRDYTRLSPVPGHPALAVTLFLHERYGEERILHVLDILQRPPWHYHHTESGWGQVGGGVGQVVLSPTPNSGSPGSAPSQPYLLPSRDFYGLGCGMPVWGVRPVHYGGETLRVTLHCARHNYEDAVHLYETVLRRPAEEQKPGFCWFMLPAERGLAIQLALKQLPPGVRVEPCRSAVLQFCVEEMGQLVPLLPNPCSPISATRWQTDDLDGNKILFQVQNHYTPATPKSAFPLSTVPIYRSHQRSLCPSKALSHCHYKSLSKHREVSPCMEEGAGSDSCCSTPPGSSCYSSQRSSPTVSSHQPTDPLVKLETNVDTGNVVTSHTDRKPAILDTESKELHNNQIDWDVAEKYPQGGSKMRSYDPAGPTVGLSHHTDHSEVDVSCLITCKLTEGPVQEDEFFI